MIDQLLTSTERDVLCSTKKQQLVNELRTRGLPYSGRKDDLITRLLEDNERRQLYERTTSAPTKLPAANDDGRQTNREAALTVENGRLREELNALRRQLTGGCHTAPTQGGTTNATSFAQRNNELDISRTLTLVKKTHAQVSEFLARSRTRSALTPSHSTSCITHAEVLPAKSNETRNARSAHEPERSTYLAPALPVRAFYTNDNVPELVQLAMANETPRARNATELRMTSSAQVITVQAHPTNDDTHGLVKLATPNETHSARNAPKMTNDIAARLVELSVTNETNTARIALKVTNDFEPGLFEPTTTNGTHSARNAHEPARTTTHVPAVRVQARPTNDIAPRPTALTTSNETDDARSATKPARVEETLFATSSDPAASICTWPANDATAGINFATSYETAVACGSTQPERTSSPAHAAPDRAQPTNGITLSQVDPSTNNETASACSTSEPERTRSLALAAPIETRPKNATMAQEDAAASKQTRSERNAIEPACASEMPTAALLGQRASDESSSDDKATATTTTNETGPDEDTECSTDEAPHVTPRNGGPSGRDERRPFPHRNGFTSEGNHDEGDNGVATILADQPPHHPTTTSRGMAHHRRVTERTNGFRSARNARLKRSNAYNVSDCVISRDRTSPPNKTDANVPTRTNHATSYTDTIADGSDVTNAVS